MSNSHITANGKDCLSVVANGTEKYRVTGNGDLIYAKGRIEYNLGSTTPSGASGTYSYSKYIYVYYG